MRKLLITLVLSLTLAGTALAAHRSTPEEAKAFFDDAIATYSELGREAALAAFNEEDGKFSRGDLYVFAIDPQGDYLASGANPALAGTALKGTEDAAGNSIYDMIMESLAAAGDEAGTIAYQWLNRQTNQLEDKTAYVQQIDDVIIGVGYYH
ncbi:cache domain-containing protein [Granulosicoccaceae sp. 1_MG-2023]|nr:cache domain-containing protein [Granulosicoccaceae sp. 1_MG-2023]